MKFNTIHLFGYGEGQIIGIDDNEKGFNLLMIYLLTSRKKIQQKKKAIIW
jgi:hypothetical protein